MLRALSIGAVVFSLVYPYFSGERRSGQAHPGRDGEQDRGATPCRRRRTAARTVASRSPSTLKELEKRQKAAREGHPAPAPAARRARNHAAASIGWRASACGLTLALIVNLTLPAPNLADHRGHRRRRSSASSACRAGSSAKLTKRRQDEVPRRVRQRHRHHRARRQVRPAAQRMPWHHRARKSPQPIAGEFTEVVEQQRVGVPLGEALRAHDDAHAAGGGALLRHRHRHSAAGRRQPVGGARQPLAACCATASACRPRCGALARRPRPRPLCSRRCPSSS